MPLKKNVLKPLAKSVLIPLGLTAAASATNATIHEKMVGSGTAILMISNEGMNNIMKIVKNLVYSKKELGKQSKNEAKEQKSRFLGMY